MHEHLHGIVADFSMTQFLPWMNKMAQLRHDANYCLCFSPRYGYGRPDEEDFHRLHIVIYFRNDFIKFIFIKDTQTQHVDMNIMEPMYY